MVDLCQQRSEEGGSGCNDPGEIPELPISLASGCDTPPEVAEPSVPLVSSPRSPVVPVVQVRQFSWHFSDKHDTSDIGREFVGTNKRTNSGSLFLPSQKPLVSKVHLLKVVSICQLVCLKPF